MHMANDDVKWVFEFEFDLCGERVASVYDAGKR